MIVNRTNLMLTCAALVTALAGTSASLLAQQRTSDARILELVQQAAQIVASGQVGAATTAQQGGQTTPPAEGPKVSLTLDDAVKLTLDRNLDIAVQRLNPQINDIAYASAQAFYSPTLTSTIQTQSVTQASTNTIQGGAIGSGVTNGTGTFNGGIAQNLSWGGGNYQVALNNARGTTTSLINRYNPSYTPLWSGQYIPAPAPRLQDRFGSSTAAGHQTVAGHLGCPVEVDDYQHALKRAKRILGLCVRDSGRRGGSPVRRSCEQAGRGQPDTRPSGHHGADRRGPGAGPGRARRSRTSWALRRR